MNSSLIDYCPNCKKLMTHHIKNGRVCMNCKPEPILKPGFTIQDLCETSSVVAHNKGWHDRNRLIPEIIALIHSELSEALECARKHEPSFYIANGEPSGIITEFADVFIRVCDYLGYLGLGEELESAIIAKTEYNKTREHRHGGKEF